MGGAPRYWCDFGAYNRVDGVAVGDGRRIADRYVLHLLELGVLGEDLSRQADQPMPTLWIAPTMAPNAFATGRNPKNAAVCVTAGILDLLNERELRGVIGHELSHVYNRDILITAIASSLAGIMAIAGRSLLWMGGYSRRNRDGGGAAGLILSLVAAIVAPLIGMLIQLAISRTREYEADHDGAILSHDPLALASALKKLEVGTT